MNQRTKSNLTKPMALRTRVVQTDDSLLLIAKPNKASAIFMILWLIGWSAGCVMLGGQVIANPGIGIIAFSIPFFASWFFVAACIVWALFGEACLMIEPHELVFSKKALIPLRERRIPRSEVIRAQSFFSTNDENVRTYGIEVVTTGSPVRFGR